VEIDFDIDQNSHCHSILAAGFELPQSNCFDGLLIKTHAYGLDYANIVRPSVSSHHDLQDDSALILSFARFVR
jgi:hypothetical protein